MHRLWIMYITVFSLVILTDNELTDEKNFTVGAAKLTNFKGIVTLKFVSKAMLLWKRGPAFIFTEDEKLWNSSR